MALDDKYIGLILALVSSFLIGSSFILTKLGLLDSRKHGGPAGESHDYLHNPKWWAGMIIMVLGELANFAAYSFAPALLVTPLGAGSVLISAVLASFFLNEKLSTEGKIGCALCILGSMIIVLHSPEEKAITSVAQFMDYATRPAFMIYMLFVCLVSLYLIYRIGPVYGKRNLLVYISICSLVGSISVMAVKGFGIALKLTFAGHNQLIYPSTYVFAISLGVCAVTQMNYFNKALDLFSTNRVTPIYYVFFTSATVLASVILFQGFNETSTVDVASLFAGFIIIFIGVFQLNNKKETHESSGYALEKLAGSASHRPSIAHTRRGTEEIIMTEIRAAKPFDEERQSLKPNNATELSDIE
ncbi:hypothetical protein CXG81DRAFT_8989 [Caulochytrium protostelioides]|uniref:DUF803-domain-containing protein n=1 Tax=Caulochytrium protostelioides TaxID=1555241 RepID=A0A4P9XE67_9FUNG|nr:hypothetical protein CXG81DRAFT_8989 [Caulochytrium protostelioides]|eukprot:RKP03813.1 hypothetical protein CXG81DRAFT_8989 [Caulochytrium protostelioides]